MWNSRQLSFQRTSCISIKECNYKVSILFNPLTPSRECVHVKRRSPSFGTFFGLLCSWSDTTKFPTVVFLIISHRNKRITSYLNFVPVKDSSYIGIFFRRFIFPKCLHILCCFCSFCYTYSHKYKQMFSSKDLPSNSYVIIALI